MPIYRWANLDAIIICMQRHKFHRSQLLATVLAAAVVLPSCRVESAVKRSAKAAGVSAWVTSADKQMLLARVALDTTSVGQSTTVTIDTSAKFQTITGFGAALTDASVWVLQHHLTNTTREQLLLELFTTSDGIGLGFLHRPRSRSKAANASSHSHTQPDAYAPGDAVDRPCVDEIESAFLWRDAS